ncbi:UNVERIFIED_CONTAM: hypothetical protein K2H54_022954 [Gekko kuhli]
MSLSSFEVAMQTMACVLSDCLKDKNGVPVITTDGLNQLVKEQFPHCEKKEICPGVYEIRIPLRDARKCGVGSPCGIPSTREEIPRNTEDLVVLADREVSTGHFIVIWASLQFVEEGISPEVHEIKIPLRDAGEGAVGSPHGIPSTQEETPRHMEDLVVSAGREESTEQLRGQKLLQISDSPDDDDILEDTLIQEPFRLLGEIIVIIRIC